MDNQAASCQRERQLLDSAMESQQARSPLVEQKPPELVGRPFAVIVYFYVRHGSNGSGQRGAATHNWFGRFWTVAVYVCFALGLLVGQILVYRIYRENIIAA